VNVFLVLLSKFCFLSMSSHHPFTKFLVLLFEVLPVLLTRKVCFRTGSFPTLFGCSADFWSEPRLVSGEGYFVGCHRIPFAGGFSKWSWWR
jgi:hypothetical protein